MGCSTCYHQSPSYDALQALGSFNAIISSQISPSKISTLDPNTTKTFVSAARLQQLFDDRGDLPTQTDLWAQVSQDGPPTAPIVIPFPPFTVSHIPSEYDTARDSRATKSTSNHDGDPWEVGEDGQHEGGGAGFVQGRPWTAPTNPYSSDWANPPCSARIPELTSLYPADVHPDTQHVRGTLVTVRVFSGLLGATRESTPVRPHRVIAERNCQLLRSLSSPHHIFLEKRISEINI
jgi:hypothetical protein